MSTGRIRRRRRRHRFKSRLRAEERLLDRVLFPLDPATLAKVRALLDAPAAPNERLCRTMRTPAPWEEVGGGRR